MKRRRRHSQASHFHRAPSARRRTKNDCGDCPAVHDDSCKQQWEELDDRSKERYG